MSSPPPSTSELLEQVNAEIGRRNEEVKQLPTPENPLTYTGKVDLWEIFKMVLGIVVFPVKAVLVFLLVALGSCFGLLATSFGWDSTKPMTGLRRLMIEPIRYLSRACLFVYGFYWVKVKGKPASTDQARIIVGAPHTTVVDSLYLAYVYGLPSVISKAEVGDLPVFGPIFKATQAIFVDRDSKTAKQDVLDAMLRRVKQPGARQIMLFPEGTCTNRTSLMLFQRGAFVPGVPVQPVLLRFPFQHFDPTWTSGGPNRYMLIARLLMQFYNNLEVEFMDVVVPTAEEKADPILFAQNVRAKMAAKLGVPTTEFSYADAAFAKKARKVGRDHTALVPYEMSALGKRIAHPITTKLIHDAFKVFVQAPAMRKNEAAVTASMFISRVLTLPKASSTKALCSAMDPGKVGGVEFMNFVISRRVFLELLYSDESVTSIMDTLASTTARKNGSDPLISRESLANFLERAYGKSRKNTRMAKQIFLKMVESDVDNLFPGKSKRRAMKETENVEEVGERTLSAFLQSYPEYLYVFNSLLASNGEDLSLTKMNVKKISSQRKAGLTNSPEEN